MLDKVILMPARLNSKRLHQKMFKDLDGKPLLYQSYWSAREVCNNVYITTEDAEIADFCHSEAIPFILNQQDGSIDNGTKSCYNARAVLMQERIIDNRTKWVNVQADCPFFDRSLVKKIFSKDRPKHVVTGYYESISKAPPVDKVKIVMDRQNHALYFSRENIPHNSLVYNIHVGIYGLPRWENLFAMKWPSDWEQEKLEQLAWLYYGVPIKCILCKPAISIDTQEDLDLANEAIKTVGWKAVDAACQS